jgi:protein-S-isoprenylcysteine O-methyltransferase Ste14
MAQLLLALLVWAVVHSLTAGPRTKSFVRRLIGERAYQGTYRLVYNVFSAVTLVPVFYLLAVNLPNQVLWSVPAPYQWLNAVVQVAALAGLALSLLQTDVWSFIGLRQLLRYLQGQEQPDPPARFVDRGTYALVRHPLYFFSLLYLWVRPEMTISSLVLCLWVTAYFLIGSIFEERRLIREFGAEYHAYRARVPRLLPLRLPTYSGGGDK